jgi:hypothetical protein
MSSSERKVRFDLLLVRAHTELLQCREHPERERGIGEVAEGRAAPERERRL